MELQNIQGVKLANGGIYNGWGFYKNGLFIPHGSGKLSYENYYVRGNFVEGLLDGPAIVSHDYCMTTAQFKNDRGNGWGLCINSGILVEFGYYENSQLKVNLLDFVNWYYEKMKHSWRAGENMLNIYSSKATKEVTDLLIGYANKMTNIGLPSGFMGFHFLADGSVWMGDSEKQDWSGDMIHFLPNGTIDCGHFRNGILTESYTLQKLIDIYYGTEEIPKDSIVFDFFPNIRNRQKTEDELEDARRREQFRGIEEPRVDFNYFTGLYSDGLPF